jgi:hypothetical protein
MWTFNFNLIYLLHYLHFFKIHCIVVNRCPWRGGRVVEGAALEMLLCGNVYEGSNPSLSVPKKKIPSLAGLKKQ